MNTHRLAIALLVCSAILFGLAATAQAYSYPPSGEEQLSTNSADEFSAAMSGTNVVYEDGRTGYDQIYCFNLLTGVEKQLTTNAAEHEHPAVSGNYVVYSDDGNGTSRIFCYDLATDQQKPLTNGTQVWDGAEDPAISGNLVVYDDFRGGNWDIYCYDLGTSTEKQVTTNGDTQENPAISGTMVVFEDLRSGHHNVYSHDLATGAEKPLTATLGSFSPRISGNKVVYYDVRNGTQHWDLLSQQWIWTNYDVYCYDLAIGTEKRVSASTADQTNPSVSGNSVVYSDTRNGNYDIYRYDLATGAETRLTTNPSNQTHPVISGDDLIYEDNRSGDTDIYLQVFKPTSVSTPRVSPPKPKHGKKATFTATLAPSGAAPSGGSRLLLSHSETKTVTKVVHGKKKKVKVSYWHLRSTVTMAAGPSGNLTAKVLLRYKGKWKMCVCYSGSATYYACQSASKSFTVK